MADRATENDYLKFKKLLTFFVRQANKNAENENVEKPTINSEGQSENFRLHYGLDKGYNIIAGREFSITFFKLSTFNTKNTTYMNVGDWLNINAEFNDNKMVLKLKTEYRSDHRNNESATFIKEKMSEQNKGCKSYFLDELKLDDSLVFNNNLKNFLDQFIEMDVYLTSLLKKNANMQNIESYKELLSKSRNLILTGAPGTGKTYLAKQIAENFIKINNGKWDFVQFHPSYDYTDFVEGLRPTPKEEQKEIGFALKDGIFKKFCNEAKNNTDKTYVFIIDEINRGEISKIFGELFFSIEPSYRGPKGEVATQYQNMHDGDEKFYVPENVYIIGTMNDIDRSVESFDFAMRRRFTWVEITAKKSQKMFFSEDGTTEEKWVKEAIKRMDALNKVIWDEEEKKGIDGLNSSYHIGGAYFKTNLPTYKYDDETFDFDKLWKYHIEPLVKEYLREMLDCDTKLNELKNAYDLKPNTETKQLEDNSNGSSE